MPTAVPPADRLDHPSGGGLSLVTQYVVDGLGRHTQITDPNGYITYIVYDDVDHEERIYAGWNSSSHTPTEPTQMIRQDMAISYTETPTMTATPSLTRSDVAQEFLQGVWGGGCMKSKFVPIEAPDCHRPPWACPGLFGLR
jgi:hypothetical protein